MRPVATPAPVPRAVSPSSRPSSSTTSLLAMASSRCSSSVAATGASSPWPATPYLGLDVARSAIGFCIETYSGDLKHRNFTDHVAAHFPEWELAEMVPDRYPVDQYPHPEDSFSDFYIYRRR